MKTMSDEKRLAYPLKQGAAMVGIATFTLRRMALNGQIKFARVGRKILIPATELERICAPGADSGPTRVSAEKKGAE
jgi:excisionase family DNA binding protein